jgi:kynureninase
VESQIRHHNIDPKDAMVLIEPDNAHRPILSTEQILRVIDEHASSTALILLPGIQFYTGQYFDIEKITAHAHSKGIIIGWDCAHAAGNVDLRLHDWNVDFAAWCNYKYLNSGPGGMAALFVHESHGRVDADKVGSKDEPFRPRLSGWWGDDKKIRFRMENSMETTYIASLSLTNLFFRIRATSRRSRIPAVESVSFRYERSGGVSRDIQSDVNG